MIIGIPREVKKDEYRIAILPVGVALLKQDGHRVIIQKDAGLGSGFDDSVYADVGAEFVDTASEVFSLSDMIMKVKEPQAEEIAMLKTDQIVFCYFHFAGSRELTEGCLNKKISAVAFETLSNKHGQRPLLTPMSEVAGRMSIQEGAKCLEKPMMGRGILLGGVPGVKPAHILIIGGGIVGSNAAHVAAGIGANVVIMDINLDRLRYLNEIMPPNVTTIYCDPHAVEHYALESDLIIGAVLIPGGKAPQLINRNILAKMQKGSVFVDVSIDQGGCCETSHPTTHSAPTYIEEDVVHYCVANMPGAVGRTSTQALCNATLPFCRELANIGLDAFIGKSEGRNAALNMRNGKLTFQAVSEVFSDLPTA